MIVKHKLARSHVPAGGEECLPSKRLIEMFHGANEWTPEETAHLRDCDWCAYFGLHGYDDCPSTKRLLAWAHGGEPTKEEWRHLSECPACAEDYQNVTDREGSVPKPSPELTSL